MGDKGLCRLCAEIKPHLSLINIKNDQGQKLELETKILRCFQIRITNKDPLPQHICVNCYHTSSVTWEFVEQIQRTEDTLRTILMLNHTVGKSVDKKFVSINSDKSPSDIQQGCCSVDIVDCDLIEKEISNSTNDQEIKQESDETLLLEKLKSPSKRKRHLPMKMEESILEDDDEQEMEPRQKRRPGRPKGRKNKVKEAKEIIKIEIKEPLPSDDSECEPDIGSDDELSGVSDSERNEDGSLNGTKARDNWDTYPWVCADCSEKHHSVMDLRTHYNEHHHMQPKYLCVDCTKPYNKYHTFVSHVRAHRTHLRFCCDMCSKYYTSRKALGMHRSGHSENRPHICRTCGKGFRVQSALIVHSRSHLPEELKNKYHCDICPKRFGTKPNLMAHKRIHTGIRDYTCDQCGKSFIQKGNLDNHMLTHMATRPYACDICGKAFKTLMRLKKHETVHSGLKPHQCDVCGRQFRERGTLREHHRIHTGAMPFTCEFCGKCFRFKGVLTTHRRQHTGERPYSCLECQHHFTNWPNYNKHMKRRHGINTSVTVRKPQTIPPTGMPDRANQMHIVPTIHNNMQGTIGLVQHEVVAPPVIQETDSACLNSRTPSVRSPVKAIDAETEFTICVNSTPCFIPCKDVLHKTNNYGQGAGTI